MKPLPAIAAATIAVALLLVPLSAAAAGSISFTSPAANASYKGLQSYTISGTISPAPAQADNVGIIVKNPSGTVVDQGNVAVTSGAFSYPTGTGSSVNPSLWPSGTYTIIATDSYSATGSTTFQYSATTSPVYNVTRALVNIQGNLTQIKATLAALQGAEATEQKDMKGNFTALNAQISSGLTALAGQLTTVTNNLATLTANVGTLQTDYTNLQGQLTTISGNIATLTTDVLAAQTAANNAQAEATTANNSVSSTQTYVLVVAVLAAITLVLELAILVRKLS